MKTISILKYWQLVYFSQPKCDRLLYRLVIRNRVQSILEIGIESLERSRTLVQLARRNGPAVRYTGVDLFEARGADRGALSLKDVHRELKPGCAKLQLLPGTLGTGLAQFSSSLKRTDLIVISAGYAPSELQRALYFIPRMLHSGSAVLLQGANDHHAPFEVLNRIDIERRGENPEHAQGAPRAA